jgi:hypothetical protein
MLTSIGIGAPPASFSDAKTAASDQKAAVGGLTSTVSGISSSLSVLTAVGAPASVTGPMKDNLTSANALMTNASKMTPAELMKKTAAIQSQHDIDTANQANTARNEDLAELIAAEKEATKVVKPILADNRTSQGTRDACASLIEEIQKARKTISETLLTKSENATGGSGDKPLIYLRPKVLTAEDVDIYLSSIQDSYDDETENNFTKLYRNATKLYYKYVWPAIFYMTFIGCVLIAGIISSNACLPTELYSVYNRAFYFIYGAILFPITLPMYSILKPPEWYSTICPLFSNDGTGPLVADDPPGTASLANKAASALSSVSSFFKMSGGAETQNPPVKPAAPTLKGPTYYFYPLVNNATTKATLSKMSLVATILVWGYIVSKGGLALVSSL